MQTSAKKSTSVFTSIRITPVHAANLRAMASCIVGGAMWVTGMRIVEGKNGLFVSMPSRRNMNGEYQDVAFPCSKEMREELQRVVLEEYEKTIQPGKTLAA